MKDIIFPITYKTDTKGLKESEDGLTKLGNFAGKAGFAIAAGLAVASAAAVAFGVESLKAAAEAEAITRGLENAAKNAGVFGDKAASITEATAALDAHSKKLGELTGIDDELINQLKTGWLAVPDLAAKGTDGINKLAEAAADIAKGTGKDITAVAMAFTKITGDSETALSKLTRIGIVLSDQQKATFEDILATNGEIAAQDYLLQQLGDKYKGAAEAAANPFERLDVIFGNLKETIGGALLPAFEQVVPIIQSFIEEMVADPEFQAFLDSMAATLESMLPKLQPILSNFGDLLGRLLPGLNPLLKIMSGLLETISLTMKGLGTESGNLYGSWESLAYIIGNINSGLTDWTKFLDSIKLNLGDWGPFVESVFVGILRSLDPVFNMLKTIEGLMRWISGNPVRASGITYNKNGTPDRDGNPATPMALGGIVLPRPGGMLAQIGEAGKAEAVIPLDRLAGMIGGGGGATYNISVNAGMGTDGAALGEQIVTAIRKYERTSGAVFAKA
jgi:hypothetical protein